MSKTIAEITEQILQYVKVQGKVTSGQILKGVGASPRTMYRIIAGLVASGALLKEGKAPQVFYSIGTPGSTSNTSVSKTKTSIPKPKPIPAPKEAPVSQPALVEPASSEVDEPKAVPEAPAQIPLEGAVSPHLAPLEFWCNKLKLDQKMVEDCHHEMYEWAFTFPYGNYNIPWGLLGKIVDFLMWTIAIALVWFWKIKGSSPKLAIGFLIVAVLVIGALVWHAQRSAKISQANNGNNSEILGAQQNALNKLQMENQSLNQELGEVKEKLDQSKRDLLSAQNNLNSTAAALKSKTADAAYYLEQMDVLKQRNSASLAEVENWRGKFNQMEGQYKDARGQLSSANTQIDQLKGMKSQVQEALDQKSKLEEENGGLNRTLLELRSQLQKSASELAAQKQQNDQLQKKISALEEKAAQPASVPMEAQHMTIDEVIEWTKQGRSAADIIAHIKETHSTYKLIPADVQYLQGAHVEENVIKTMMGE